MYDWEFLDGAVGSNGRAIVLPLMSYFCPNLDNHALNPH